MHFDDSEAPGEVVSGRCFCSERSIGHPKQQTAVPSGMVGVEHMASSIKVLFSVKPRGCSRRYSKAF